MHDWLNLVGSVAMVLFVVAAYVVRWFFKKELLKKLYNMSYQSKEYTRCESLIFLIDEALIFLFMFTALILAEIFF